MSEMDKIAGPGLKLLHVNAQSLFPKLGEIQLLVNSATPDILCVTESWLTPAIPDGMIALDIYVPSRCDREAHRRGGVLVTYFNNNFASCMNYEKHQSSWRSNSDIEVQVFKMKIWNIKKIALINVYRPPAGSADNFIAYLTEVLESIPKLHEYEIYNLGDMNLPYNQTQSTSYRKLKVFKAQFGLQQLITVPTHFEVGTANILQFNLH